MARRSIARAIPWPGTSRPRPTKFITDPRYGDEFVEIRKQYFTRGCPGSALISVYSLARPEMLVEVQASAVLDE